MDIFRSKFIRNLAEYVLQNRAIVHLCAVLYVNICFSEIYERTKSVLSCTVLLFFVRFPFFSLFVQIVHELCTFCAKIVRL